MYFGTDNASGILTHMIIITVIYLFVVLLRSRQKRGLFPANRRIDFKVATVAYIVAMVLYAILLIRVN
jgi:hypothetical protein